MRPARPARPRGQNWKTFFHTHAEQIWACDFLPVTDLFCRSLFAFFIIELHSREVIHVGVTRDPTDAWTAQQLREATAYGVGPKYLCWLLSISVLILESKLHMGNLNVISLMDR